jgi:hypothetical protein
VVAVGDNIRPHDPKSPSSPAATTSPETMTFGVSHQTAGDTVQVVVTLSDQVPDSQVTYDWGDGTTETTTEMEASHTYAVTGTNYAVVVSVAPPADSGYTVEGDQTVEVPIGEVPAAGAAPVLTSLDPGTAEMGGPDTTLTVNGTGFTAESVIYFNGGAEPTTFVSDAQVTTGLKPSTASGPWTVPVHVQNGEAQSNALDFSFTEPGTAPPTVVTAPGQGGWTVRNQTGGGVMAFVAGPTGNPAGTGALRLTTGDSADDEISLQYATSFGSIAEITDLSYITSTASANGNAANVVLVLECSGGEGYLIHIAEGDTAAWQNRDALAGNWWTPFPCVSDGGAATRTWAEWVTALAGVPVKACSLGVGSGEANTDTFVTSFTLNGAVTDFEAAAPL